MSTKIKQIVQLKGMMKRWRSLSLRSKPTASNILHSSSDSVVRAGFIAIDVGLLSEAKTSSYGLYRQRFVIPLRFLNYPVFRSLLMVTEEEIGFAPDGVLAISCDVGFFREVVGLLGKDEGRFKGSSLTDFEDYIFSSSSLHFYLGCNSGGGGGGSLCSPLLEKAASARA